MKLWILKRLHDRPAYDAYDGFVVRAASEIEARVMVGMKPGDKGSHTWRWPSESSCVELLVEGEPGILLSDFNAG